MTSSEDGGPTPLDVGVGDGEVPHAVLPVLNVPTSIENAVSGQPPDTSGQERGSYPPPTGAEGSGRLILSETPHSLIVHPTDIQTISGLVDSTESVASGLQTKPQEDNEGHSGVVKVVGGAKVSCDSGATVASTTLLSVAIGSTGTHFKEFATKDVASETQVVHSHAIITSHHIKLYTLQLEVPLVPSPERRRRTQTFR